MLNWSPKEHIQHELTFPFNSAFNFKFFKKKRPTYFVDFNIMVL